MIPYGRQQIDDDDIEAVVRVLKGDWLTQGPHVAAFEQAIAGVTGAAHAVAFANGTAALHGATAAASLGPGDRVVTSPLTFIASANAARFVGASIELVDIDSTTLLIDPEAVPDCDALIAVHYAGLPVDLTKLRTRPRIIIEDAAHALGAMTPDGPVGNCAHSDMCMFSFHPVKHVTTGEGGVITTNSDELAARLRRFRSHGTVPNPSEGGWAYDVVELAYNYRLTDIQAALGTSQLRKLGHFVNRRNEIAARYRDLLAGAALELPPQAPHGWRHAYHLFPVRVDHRRRVYDSMRESGIGVQVHYVPVHHHSLYRHLDAHVSNSDAAYERLLSLPIFPALTTDEQDHVVAALLAAL